ncbi:hypothetical protein SmJEL517_g05234 [Synchytrium microbalum]|uniref:5-demethoxyubiquinone hydroxylase, mitochondrial n=1 Tax=Synchytrium microbalum TaxID=1806994 RepID=A0A507C1J5_9FUNG|nr:uncharacterized protein SmJEL517_g05234 [Synchytrium microbalum]TPX31435.1 hypothetical protein SmJEL517_g05234 [Synchytrium microbalum]
MKRAPLIARQVIRAYSSTGQNVPPLSSSSSSTSNKLTPEQRSKLIAMLRVDHAGEIGADFIYRGQLAVLGSTSDAGRTVKRMHEQEELHLKSFDTILANNRVRPSALRPLWETAGFAMGVGSALLGKEAAMACTEAVETVIGEHYNDQLRELLKMEGNEDVAKLQQVIKDFRDDELEHLDTAVNYDAHQAPLYTPLTAVIKQTCRVAIWVAQRI